MKKLLIAILLIVAMVFTSVVYADAEISVLIDGTKLSFDQAPIMENDRVLVPLRAIFEALGCNVHYYDSTETISAQKGDKKISLQVGSNQMLVNDEVITIDVPAKVLNDRTLVPVRAISEALDCWVGWTDETSTVSIESDHGLHTYTYQNGSQDFLADNGTTILIAEYTILQIDNPNNLQEIKNINSRLKQDIEDYLYEVRSNVLPEAISRYNREKSKPSFTPYVVTHSASVTTDRKDIISISNVEVCDYHDGEQNLQKSSSIYSLRTGLLLGVDDIFIGTIYDALDIVTYAFRSKIAEDESLYYGDAIDTLESDFDNVKYYATDSAIVAYYDAPNISPTLDGYVDAEIPYIGNEDIFEIDFADGGLNTLTIKLFGNAKSGYKWAYKNIPKYVDISNPKIYDALDEVTSFPIGSIFEFNITGLNQGRCTLEFNYYKSDDTKVQNSKKYEIYVTKDNLITVLKEL